jgi:multiple sugar transport system substrate-binding protein
VQELHKYRMPASAVGLLAACWLTFALLGVACDTNLLDPPRLATQTAQSQAISTVQSSSSVSVAPTATGGALPAFEAPSQDGDRGDQRLIIWVNETSAEHEAASEQIIDAFSVETGIQVELLLISDSLLPELVHTAVISGGLPDLILHPIEYSAGWAERGILDANAAAEIIARLGPETFDPGGLQMAALGHAPELYAAVPAYGWEQLLIYRSDWFREIRLEPPDSYERLLLAAETTFRPDDLISGLVVPTDSALTSTQQVFEWIATANGCELADASGEVTLLHPACLEALDYYRVLINEYSPLGVQTDTSALNAYLAGRTGIIAASPHALPAIAGLVEEQRPGCPRCSSPGYLMNNSAIVTTLSGTGDLASPAHFGEITALGITATANKEAAIDLAAHWLGPGYSEWIAIDPVRKAPMRLGTREQPLLFHRQWGDLPLKEGSPGLSEVLGEELANQLLDSVAAPERWGFKNGQAALTTRIYEELVLSPLLQEMLSGYFTSSQTIIEMHRAVIELIPDYNFPVPVVATEEPDVGD